MLNWLGLTARSVRRPACDRSPIRWLWCAFALWVGLAIPALAGSAPGATAAPAPAVTSSVRVDVGEWVDRMARAPGQHSYSGTFVVWAAPGAMSSSRIVHVRDGALQIERVESLSGTPRIVYRRNDEVRTFLPLSRVVRSDQRDAEGGLFPRRPVVSVSTLGQYYVARTWGEERVAGRVADVLGFEPLDQLRFGYRIWADRETSLVVKLQTVASDGRVLEQAAFSELEMRAPVQADQLSRMMDATDGYRIVRSEPVKTTAEAEGWALRPSVAGFVPVNCNRRIMGSSERPNSVLQCLYSDGLASVSIFAEPYDSARHPEAIQLSAVGATQMLAQRVGPDVWITLVGEVPVQTLRLFAAQWKRVR